MTVNTDAIERQLDRVQAFIPRIDTRVTGYFAIVSAQAALLFSAIAPQDIEHWFNMLCLIAFLSCAVLALLNIYQCAHPTLNGNGESLIFFTEIEKLNQDDFIDKFKEQTDDGFRDDLLRQIHRNSQIVTQKYASLRRAGTSVLIGTVPWAMILLISSINNYRMPGA